MLSSFIPGPNLGNLPVVQLLCRALTAVCHLLLDEPRAAPFLGFAEHCKYLGPLASLGWAMPQCIGTVRL